METADRHRRRILVVLAMIVVLAFAAVGCSNSSGDSKSSGSTNAANGGGTTNPSKPPACPPASDVDHALKAGLDAPVDQVNGLIRTCTYNTTAGGDQVVIRFQTGVSAAAFAAAGTSHGPSGETTSPVADLGDSAYAMQRREPGGTVTELAALSGTTLVSVVAPVRLADVEVLVKSLIGSL